MFELAIAVALPLLVASWLLSLVPWRRLNRSRILYRLTKQAVLSAADASMFLWYQDMHPEIETYPLPRTAFQWSQVLYQIRSGVLKELTHPELQRWEEELQEVWDREGYLCPPSLSHAILVRVTNHYPTGTPLHLPPLAAKEGSPAA